MNPYDNNPFQTDRENIRSEFNANVALARTAARDAELAADRRARAYKDDMFRAELATRESFYQMGIRHGLTRARNTLSKILGG